MEVKITITNKVEDNKNNPKNEEQMINSLRKKIDFVLDKIGQGIYPIDSIMSVISIYYGHRNQITNIDDLNCIITVMRSFIHILQTDIERLQKNVSIRQLFIADIKDGNITLDDIVQMVKE